MWALLISQSLTSRLKPILIRPSQSQKTACKRRLLPTPNILGWGNPLCSSHSTARSVLVPGPAQHRNQATIAETKWLVMAWSKVRYIMQWSKNMNLRVTGPEFSGKCHSHFKNSLLASYKGKHKLTSKPRIPLLGIYPKEMKAYIYTKTCTWLLIAELFQAARRWK